MDVNLALPSKSFNTTEIATGKNNISSKNDFTKDLKQVQSELKQSTGKSKGLSVDKVGLDFIKLSKSVLAQNPMVGGENSDSNEELKSEVEDLIMSILVQGMLNTQQAPTEQQAKQVIMESLEKIDSSPCKLISEDEFIEFALELREQIGDEEFSNINISKLKDKIIELEKVFPQAFKEAIEESQATQTSQGTEAKYIDDTITEQLDRDHTSETVELKISNDGLDKNNPQNETKSGEFKETQAFNENAMDFKPNNSLQDMFTVPISPANKIAAATSFIQGLQETAVHKTATDRQFEKIDVYNQIIERMEVSKLLAKQEVTMQLYPKELGKIALKISEENGSIFATLKVKSEEVKEDLMKNSQKLIEGLQSKGLEVKEFSVDVENGESESNQQMQKERQKSSKRIAEIIKGIESTVNQSVSSVSNQTEVNVQV